MTASIIQISDFAARVMRRPRSDAEQARDTIRHRLAGKCSPSRISQAMARADRLIAAGYAAEKAIHRVVAWATCADEPTPPQAA